MRTATQWSTSRFLPLRRPTEDEAEDEDPPVQHKTQAEAVGTAVSDDRGQYRIFGLKPREYFVRAEDTAEPPNGVAADESFWIKQTLGQRLRFGVLPRCCPTVSGASCVRGGRRGAGRHRHVPR